MRWWTASPSGWLACLCAFGCSAIILRMDMFLSFEVTNLWIGSLVPLVTEAFRP
jgi:hypothetical protein